MWETADTLGGEPRTEGTRMGLDIAELVLNDVQPADTADQRDLSVAAVYITLAHYHEHATEMRELRRHRDNTEATLAREALQLPTHAQ